NAANSSRQRLALPCSLARRRTGPGSTPGPVLDGLRSGWRPRATTFNGPGTTGGAGGGRSTRAGWSTRRRVRPARGWERTPWHATQRAAWDALRQASRDGLDGESFEIPDLATSDVHPNGPPARVQRDSFHQQLVFGEDRVAGVARFAVAWSTPDRSDAVMRQATVLEFATDEEVESFLVDSGLAGQ